MFVYVEKWPWQSAPTSAELPLFAIGDIHGRHDLLVPLLAEIREVILNNCLENAQLVFLGDYIDRGRESLAVLRTAFEEDGVCIRHRLPGNHEMEMWRFLTATSMLEMPLRRWLNLGGYAVASELGWSDREARDDPTGFQKWVLAAFGTELLEDISSMPNHYRAGQYLFVHGGIHPDLGLATLDNPWTADVPLAPYHDPLWIRHPFLGYKGEFEEGVVVVHGHTPHNDPELKNNRINLDTRAYESGRLTAIQLLGGNMRVIQACGNAREKALGWP